MDRKIILSPGPAAGRCLIAAFRSEWVNAGLLKVSEAFSIAVTVSLFYFLGTCAPFRYGGIAPAFGFIVDLTLRFVLPVKPASFKMLRGGQCGKSFRKNS